MAVSSMTNPLSPGHTPPSATGLIKNRCHTGFTLAELLIVVAIVSIFAAILLPVFARTREKGRQASCLSNEHQLGLAILQYALDYDETLPNGINVNSNSPNSPTGESRVWPGQGWAGQSFAYARNPQIYRCAADQSGTMPSPNYMVSYGYNGNLAGFATQSTPPSIGATLMQLVRPTLTVLLFEVTNVYANIADPAEGGAPNGLSGINFSPASNGLDNRLYARTDWTTSVENRYATGYMGGRLPFNPQSTQFADPEGRHSGGSNYLLTDGHARWLRGSYVSSGLNALAEICDQDNHSGVNGCGGKFRAAGSASLAPIFQCTFSIQ